MSEIDWATVAAAVIPMGVTAVAGGAALRVRTSRNTADVEKLTQRMDVHEKETVGDLAEMKADIRWIREALERMHK